MSRRWKPKNRGCRDRWSELCGARYPLKSGTVPILPSFIGTLVPGSLMAPNHTNPGAPSLMPTPKHLGGSTSRHVQETQALPKALYKMFEPLICRGSMKSYWHANWIQLFNSLHALTQRSPGWNYRAMKKKPVRSITRTSDNKPTLFGAKARHMLDVLCVLFLGDGMNATEKDGKSLRSGDNISQNDPAIHNIIKYN